MSPRYSNVTSSIRGYDYTICITQSQIHLFNQHIGPQRVPQSSTGESRRKRVPTHMHRFMGGTHKLITKTYIKWITWYPIFTTNTHGKTYIKCSQIFKDSIRWDNSKGETQFITREKRGRRNIRSNYNSKARDTSRSCQIKNTRERDQTHSYWYIPSAPRVNYSLLIMESAGMMKMATGEGSPLRQGVGTDSWEVFGGYRGLRRRNSRSILFFNGFRICGNI